MKKLKAAIVGAGKIGNKHAKAYHSHKDTELVAICDLDVVKLQAMHQRWHCHSYTDIEQMIEREKIDMISITTAGEENASHHFAPTRTALLNGIPVLCEKPLSNSLKETYQLTEIAKQQGVPLGVNFNRRFVPFLQQAKTWIEENKLGTLLMINFTLWVDNPADTSEWYHMRALHCHSIDIMRYLCGEIEKVQMFAHRPQGRICWSNVQVNLQFESGVIGSLTGSYDMSKYHDIERCEVIGNKGRVLLENCFEKLSFYPRQKPEVTVYNNCIRRGVRGFDDTFNLRINRWISQLKNKVSGIGIDGSGVDALKSQQIIEAAILSWQNGGAVIDVKTIDWANKFY